MHDSKAQHFSYYNTIQLHIWTHCKEIKYWMHHSEIEKRVIYEDNHLLVFNKPAGLLVQGDKTEDLTLLDLIKDYIKIKDNKPGNVFLGLTHRLDRPVSGAVILAKTSKSLSRVTQAFKNKEVNKTYVAICGGRPNNTTGHVINYLLKDKQRNIVRQYKNTRAQAKLAETKYKLLHYEKGQSFLEIEPITGRSHQIRVHLAGIEIPILGDLKYGAPAPLKDKSVALHCVKMSLNHPVLKETISFKANVPKTHIWSPYTSFVDKI